MKFRLLPAVDRKPFPGRDTPAGGLPCAVSRFMLKCGEMSGAVFHKGLISVLALLVLAGCTRDPDVQKKKFLELGNRYFQQEKYEEASLLYRKALQEDGRFAEAYYRLALVRLKLGNLDGAGAALLRAFDLDPDNLDAFDKLADLYLLALSQPVVAQPKESLQNLIDLTERAERHHPGAAVIFYVKGRTALLQKDYGQAIALLRQAHEANPSDLRARVALVAALARDKQYAEAEKTAKLIIADHPASFATYDLLYALYSSQRRRTEAEAILRAKTEAAPDNARFQLQLARFYKKAGSERKAAAIVNRLKQDPEEFQDLHQALADYYLVTGEPDLAIEQLKKGMRAEPERAGEIRYTLVAILANQGKWEEALGLIGEALKQNPESPLAIGLRGYVRLRSGDPSQYDAALNDLKLAVSKLPDNPKIRFYCGEAYLAVGDRSNASTQFREALRLRPRYPEAQYALARLYLGQNSFTRAKVIADEILGVDPEDTEARLLRAQSLIGLREYGPARSELEALHKKDPRNQDILYVLARLDLIEKRYSAAEKRFRVLAEADPPSRRGIQGLVNTYLAQRKLEQLQRYLESELKRSPENTRFRMALASLAMARKDYERAEKEFKLILDGEPGNGVANLRLGEIYLVKGDETTARSYFLKAVGATPPPPLAFLHLGTLLTREGKFEEARSYFEQTIRLAPDNSVALNNLAYILAEKGTDLDQALTYAQRAVARAPGILDYADTLGYVYIKRNLNDNAIEVLQRIVKKSPSRAAYRYHLALALYQKGNIEHARTELLLAKNGKATPEEADRIQELLDEMSR